MELPRYTRPLRVYTSLAPERQLKSTDELANIYLGKSKEEKKGKTWKVITTYISKDVQSDAACAKALQNLWKQTQDIIGDDQPARIVDDGAVFLLRMFLDEEMVLLKHLSRIRQTFGKVTSATANKICETVKEIGSYLSDDSRAFIENDEPDKPSSHAAIAVGNIKVEKYTRTGTNLLHNMYKKPDKSKGFIDFSFTYKKSETTTDKGASGSGKTTIDSKFGKSWLDAEVKKYYGSGTSREPSEVDVTDSIMTLLRSPMSNDELQNELFDLLGIDKFEFIQLLFQHRTDIIGSLNKSNIPEMMASTSRNLSQPLSQVTIQSEAEKLQLKLRRKEAKRLAKSLKNHADDSEDDEDISPAVLRAKRQAQLLAPANNYLTMPSNPERVLVTKITKVRYPYVYDSQQEARERPGFIYGMKMMLPEGVERKDNKIFEEVRIPISEPAPTEIGKNLIAVSTLDEVGQLAFQGTKNLNRIQSVVFNAAYTTNENLLICAPTGAGKTNIAMLTVVHQIRQHIENNIIQRDKFKIVYVAPMKALASEMTANFGKRLQSLGVVVKELTGDMQLTKTEILQTQMLVTTPEKWDVVTRKGSGDEALIRKLRLLILDEVHLLHGDRGPVIEALVARTLRQVESSQSMIRIVGLSATLPNYLDVARFLKVNPMKGLFYFDSRFRPVPLSQIFIGVKASKSLQQMNDMDMICYDKAIEMVQKGHQVMVFVHARNATSRTALVLREMAQQKGQTQLFEPDETPALLNAKKGFSKAKNKQLTELFLSGFACHHAGMLRADRNLVEKYFSEGFIKVLVCTSTLAWGVNLPAHAVIIKGTEIYDQNRGSFVDLGILDVLQIFGRAGRPQFDKSGTGIIVTTFDKLSHYLSLLTNQFPIESNFISLMVDNLNAEIALGTITNIDEAIEWLSYTYLFVRMRLNPQVYGLTMDDVKSDPTLDTKRRELIRTAAMALDKAQMIRFNERTGDLSITDLGRTASHYYIKYDTVEVFNSKMKPIMEEGDILSMVSNAQEFQQLKVRDEELEELDELTHDNCEVSVLGGSENLHGKVNILMQTFLSRGYVKSFSLQSDLSYINQNAARLTRALFEIVLRKNNPVMAGRFLIMSKMFELQQWDFESPIRQFNCIPNDVLQKIQQKRLGIETLREMDKKELGELLRNQKIALLVKRCADEFPLLDMDASLHPITRTVLRIKLQVSANFRWNDKYHGKSESFWIWIEDPDNNFMYHSEYFQITKKQVVTGEVQELVITIPLIEPLPPQYYVRATSDRWLGSQTYLPLTFHHLILPESHPPHTDLLELQPLPVTALDEPSFEMLYNFSHFNPIQTQIFHCLYHTDNNVLLGAPTGSGKTIAAEIAMFRVFRRYPQRKVVYIAPLKALVRERIKDWKIRFEQRLKKKVVELTGDVTPDVRAIKEAHVIVTTPEKWDGISRSWQNRNYVKDVALIVIDEIHLLGEDRGPVLEVIVSRTNFISSDTSRKVRIIGLSTALANAVDLGNWLGIKDVGLYNFRPSVRPVPLEVHISGHAGKHYCPRMMSMNKPTFQAIRQHSPSSPSLVFVSSRRQTRLTALDLISYLAAEDNPKQWLHTGEEEMEQILMNIKDSNLKLTLAFGIGIHHAGLQDRDRKTTEELFVNQKIQVLICTATLAWGVNFPAHLVVIKGTEYYDGKQKRYVDMPITDVLQMMGRAGRPQFDVTGVAVVLVHDVKKNFYKKFLYEPFPVESCLLDVLPDHINAEIAAGTVHTKQQIMDYMTWTYFFRRLLNNPTYYKLETLDPLDINYYLSSLVEDAIKTLEDAGCIAVDEDNKIYATSYGTIASYYYLSHKTMLHFNNNMRFDQTFEELLRVLSDSYEYSLLPVRHNEDILNGELAQLCRLPVDPLTLDSSHTKTFLLLQAHFTNLQLPSTDYLTDLKSVLDNSIRVLQAMIDTSAECGFLATVLQCQQLMQAVIQASWPSESPLLSLPHVEIHHLHLFSRMAKITGKPCMIPAGLKAACWKNYEALASVLREDFEESQIEKIHQVIRDWPTLKIKMGIRGLLPHSPNNEEVTKQFEQPMPRDVWIAVHAEQEYTLDLDITRFGGKASSVHCPRFPKGKDEGWFITLGYMESRELIALKRATIRGRSTKQSVTFVAPTTFGRVILTVFLMSDCYLGMDQQYNIQLDVQAPANYVQ